MMKVGVTSVQYAKKIIADAIPEVVAMVEAGDVTVSEAKRVSELPKEEQAAAAKGGAKTVKAAAKKAGGAGRSGKPRPRRNFRTP